MFTHLHLPLYLSRQDSCVVCVCSCCLLCLMSCVLLVCVALSVSSQVPGWRTHIPPRWPVTRCIRLLWRRTLWRRPTRPPQPPWLSPDLHPSPLQPLPPRLMVGTSPPTLPQTTDTLSGSLKSRPHRPPSPHRTTRYNTDCQLSKFLKGCRETIDVVMRWFTFP